MKRYTDVDRESALALYAVNGNIAYVSEQTGIPETTIGDWIRKSNKTDDPIAEVRAKKKQEFAEKCWEPIQVGVELIQRQMLTARDKQDELDKLIDMVNDDEEMTSKEKMKIINSISRITRPDMRELTTAIGTLYDKQALASGDNTSKHEVSGTVTIEQYLDGLKGDEY